MTLDVQLLLSHTDDEIDQRCSFAFPAVCCKKNSTLIRQTRPLDPSYMSYYVSAFLNKLAKVVL